MGKINILSSTTINKISAGEVIERPANVVKELVENSIDANSTYINVEFEDVGKKLIKVVDNGIGMSQEDAVLAFQRYATSKIKEFDDIFGLLTLGFRGEALPSIASVSKVRLLTKASGNSSGYEVIVEGGTLVKSCECGTQPGTSLEVKDLFFNTPVRLKFLKSDTTERSEIIHTIQEYCLSYPEIGFSLNSDGKTIIKTPPTKDIKERIFDILGNEILSSLLEINFEVENIKITGFVSKKEYSLLSKNQYIFVNKRPINSRVINQAIYDVYREYLPKTRHPSFILFLNINPSLIDVNIHPTKRVIKFSDEKGIYNIIFNLTKNAIKENSHAQFMPQIKHREEFQAQRITYHQEKIIDESKPQEQKTFAIIGRAFDTYIILQQENTLSFVDQHAACERVLYEKFLKASQSLNGWVMLQEEFLSPVLLTLPSKESEILKENLETLNELGFGLEEFGPNSFKFKSYPKILGSIKDAREFIDNFLSLILDEKSEFFNIKQQREKIILAACRTAVKSRTFLSTYEMYKLIEELNKCEQPSVCPHGRPIFFNFSFDELARKFKG